MGYKQMSADEQILSEFPGLTQGELDQVNGFFSQYLFYETVPEGRRVWTTCCHQEHVLFETIPRTETCAHRQVIGAEHNQAMACPFCGKMVTAKNRRKLGKGIRLREYIPVLFLRASKDGGTLYAQGYWTCKTYLEEPAAYPRYMPTNVYRFRRGEVLQWERREDGRNSWRMERVDKSWISEPFTDGTGYMFKYCAYKVVGIEALEHSFLRYSGADCRLYKEEEDLWVWTRKRKDLVRLMALASRYPEHVELLLKFGMDGVVRDWVYHRKKNADVLHWGETDPRAAFGLSGGELRAFLAGSKDLEVLRVYKRLRKVDGKVTIGETEAFCKKLKAGLAKELSARMKKLKGLSLRRLLRYLEGMAGPRCHGGGVTLDFVAEYWRDYIDSSVILGYDLKNPIIQMPRELEQAHDRAAKAVSVLMAERRAKEGSDRHLALQRRYAFETERYLIRAPLNAKEIVAEGKTLAHCVGGYVDRHENGTMSILFLRDRAHPETPLVTIEMSGRLLMQVHGYHNERTSCGANPKRIDPRKLYAEILDPWLEWVKAGSKRDKEGRPRLPKRRTVNAA